MRVKVGISHMPYANLPTRFGEEPSFLHPYIRVRKFISSHAAANNPPVPHRECSERGSCKRTPYCSGSIHPSPLHGDTHCKSEEAYPLQQNQRQKPSAKVIEKIQFFIHRGEGDKSKTWVRVLHPLDLVHLFHPRESPF